MKKQEAPAKERIVEEEDLRATTGGSGYVLPTGKEGDPPPDPNGGT
jgi:hypothetical protein